MSEPDEPQQYGLGRAAAARAIAPPALDWRAREPRDYAPGIGLVGCGGISAQHLGAYRAAGYRVVALCSKSERSARARQREFFPDADVVPDHRALLARDDVEVVDVATHPAERLAIVADALRARKHVLSQKPFVLDLDEGERLVALAEANEVRLAVNQNGRWAPHFAAVRAAAAQGLLGEVTAVDFHVRWDHGWVVGTPLDDVEHLCLFDFGIHWFDMAAVLFAGRRTRRVYASVARTPRQRARQPLLAHAVCELDEGRATLAFDGDSAELQLDETIVAGTAASLHSRGPDLQHQRVTYCAPAGQAELELAGAWFPDGFRGAMAELLCAIEEGREPVHSARDNLTSLALCFAACASSLRGEPVVPGEVRRLG